MKIPCFESQATKDEPFYDEKAEKAFWNGSKLGISPQVAKAFYQQAKMHYDNGLGFEEMIDKMHQTSGLRKDTIAKILAANKTARKMTDDMWVKAARYREIKSSARLMAEHANTADWVKKADFLWDSSRTLATAFHGGALPFTHARNLIMGTVQEKAIWAGMVKDAYRYMTPNKGAARWAEDMANMVKTDEWKEAVRYGVEARPGDRPVGIISKVTKGWGMRGFDALKPGRVKLFHLLKNYAEGKEGYFISPKTAEMFGLRREVKPLDEQSLRMLAREVNYATGAMRMPSQIATPLSRISFAPKLWVTKRMEAYSPIRYFAKAGRMTAGERAVANLSLQRWARHVVTAAAILEANDAFNKYVLKSDHRVNFADFRNPGTLWRINVGGHIIPLSPLVEVIRAPVAMIAALTATRRQLHGEAPVGAAAEIFTREILNALHPSLIGTAELISGREVFGVPRHLRRLPFPGVAQLTRGEEPEKDKPMGWTEYLAEKGPIPGASFAREVFSPALQEQGIEKEKADKWTEGLLNGFLSFGGLHSFEVSPKSAPERTRYHRTPGTLK